MLLLQGPYTSGRSLAGAFDPDLLSITLGTDYGQYVAVRLALVMLAGAVVLTGHLWPARVRTAGAATVAVACVAASPASRSQCATATISFSTKATSSA